MELDRRKPSHTNKKRVFILRDDDPLDIRKVSLPGALPSLETEARIAVRQWVSKNRGGRNGGKPTP